MVTEYHITLVLTMQSAETQPQLLHRIINLLNVQDLPQVALSLSPLPAPA